VAEACGEACSDGVDPVEVELVLVLGDGGLVLVFVEVVLGLVLFVLCELSVI
jgi:hypothetical protein